MIPVLMANPFYQDIVTHLGRTDRGRRCVCKALEQTFSFSVLPFTPLIKCVPTRSPSPFSCFLLDRSTAQRSKYPSTVAQEPGFKVQSFHQLKSSSCNYFSYWTNAEPGRVQLSPRACPAKYVWQSCLGISFWSAHWSDGSDFKYLLNFLQGECNFYAECHLSIEVVS